nr:sulfatase-like hydrolase/transferase [Ereboglobus luteus]
MKPATLTAAAFAAVTLPLAAADKAPAPGKQPNIIVILSDDMGYSDIGCYGSEIRTPALDALAARGLRFTQFYNGARCCPTRAALLTGLYAHQAGMGGMTRNQKLPGYTGSIRENCMTIAEMLRPAGYATYAVGKWHVSRNARETQNLPLQRGFDHYYGMLIGSASYYDPSSLARDNTIITPYNDPEGYRPANNQFYLTDAIGDNAIRYLEQHERKKSAGASASKPFFMYVAFTAAHWPLQAFPEDIAKYKGAYDAGYDAIRQARHKRLAELGLLPPGTKLSPPDNTAWKDIQDKEWEIRCMEVYAAMIDRMDQNIARIVAHLKTTGQLDNTVIFFMQDNGACAEIFTQRDNLTFRWHNGPPPATPSAASSCASLPTPPPPPTRPSAPTTSRRETIPCKPATDAPCAPAPRSCPAPTTPTSATDRTGPTSPTPPSANTSTGCTKAASARRSSSTGPPAFPPRSTAALSAPPRTSSTSPPPALTWPAQNIPPNAATPRSHRSLGSVCARSSPAPKSTVPRRYSGSTRATAPCAMETGNSSPKATTALGNSTT